MACYFPICIRKNSPKPMVVPCGRCIGCRLERSRQWAVRCVHESQMHSDNCFLTLTYSDEQLIYGLDRATLFPRHLTLFFKRLRKRYGNGIRYFACGEYGDRSLRPHYHACLFGLDFSDKTFLSSKDDNNLYHSNILDDIWTHGYCTIGAVTFDSAAYVARYIMAKKLGDTASYYDEAGIEPEFVRMSRRPGIGSSWYDKYSTDVFPHDFSVIRGGIRSRPPRYYSQKYALQNPEGYAIIQKRRLEMSYDNFEKGETTKKRLHVKHVVKLAQIQSLKRSV